MTRTIQRALDKQKAKQAMRKAFGADMPHDKDEIEFIAACTDSAHGYYLKGQHHKRERGIPHNYQQFLFHNDLNAENESEEEVFKLMYEAYLVGYQGGSWNTAHKEPSARELTARAAPGIMEICGTDMKMYGELMSLSEQINEDMVKVYADGKKLRKVKAPKFNFPEFMCAYDLIPEPGEAEKPMITMAKTLYMAYCRGYDGR